MFKLPVCPYCEKKLDYKDGMSAAKGKEYLCRKCKKLSRISFKRRCAATAAALAATAVAVNTLIFFKGNNKTLLPNIIVTMIIIALFFVLKPLCVRLLEIEGQREPEPERKLKKNRRRQKKTRYGEVSFKDNPLEGTSFDK